MNILQASEGKVFAYKDEKGEEIVLGNILYLGINDDGKRYYEIDEPKEVIPEEDSRIYLSKVSMGAVLLEFTKKSKRKIFTKRDWI